ncbi:hypothetical protein BDN71DRAFT_1576270 [Pleurotus eryngii]|uniref:Uncharacterized protein n=1 Tax=Pleurotus eryngii TaxID=5323 RepID=A0A9P5ZSS8_PLEER|nr:hypothetical protein BDN71DRAFT_1576270 [Pleurotus eryngii]
MWGLNVPEQGGKYMVKGREVKSVALLRRNTNSDMTIIYDIGKFHKRERCSMFLARFKMFGLSEVELLKAQEVSACRVNFASRCQTELQLRICRRCFPKVLAPALTPRNLTDHCASLPGVLFLFLALGLVQAQQQDCTMPTPLPPKGNETCGVAMTALKIAQPLNLNVLKWIWTGENAVPVGPHTDNSYKLFVNGNPIGTGGNFTDTEVYYVALQLLSNLFAVEVTDSKEGPAAVIASILVQYTNGSMETVITDEMWRRFLGELKGFELPSTINLSQWGFATFQGLYGVAPWGKTVLPPALLVKEAITLASLLQSRGLSGRLKNTGGPAAFLAVIQILYDDGTSETIVTDSMWKADEKVTAGFKSPKLDDSKWANATLMEYYGRPPFKFTVPLV